jgi:serine/threonine protein kinase
LLTPDQWRRIERLFESVEDAPAADRERLVYESGEDDSVRWEVLKMLKATDTGLLDVDLRARPASVYVPGDLLASGRFRIESLIAEGGMGEVYRATDTELQIPIALKTIHRIFAHDNFAIERFKQEVQLARSINHLNVCRIFDLQKQQGKGGRDEFFLTMELLSGETLRAMLDRVKRIDERAALQIIEQVLNALAASHERGVLHRDLKPSNIHLTKLASGALRVVVTDFGLATTSVESVTGEAISAGTPAYMAPEQFNRDPVTPATDVYAAGVTLYEMLCGRLPFTAKTPEDMREQKALNQAVPARQLAPGISKRWEKALHRAIQADPAKRFASAGELLAAIRPRRKLYAGWGVAAALALATAIGLAWWMSQPRVQALLPIRKITNDTGYSMEPSVSKDGQTIIYASDRGANGVRSLWKLTPGSAPAQLTFDSVDSSEPNLSPDGKWIVYRSEREGGGLYLIPSSGAIEGEGPRKITSGGTRPKFSPDGQWILYMATPATPTQLPQVYAVRALGGGPVHISAGFRDAHNPIWSEDGRHILFCGTRTPGVKEEEHDWWVIPFLTGGVARKSGMLPSLGRLAQTNNHMNRINEDLSVWEKGYVYFTSPQSDSSSVWRIRFTPDTFGLIAPPERLTYGASLDVEPAIGGGKLVFASGSSNIDIWSLKLNANTGLVKGEPARVTDNTDYEVSPSADPTGRMLVFTKALGPKRELRFMNLASDRDSHSWTDSNETADQAVWSRDGQWVAYRVFERPKLLIYIKNPNGDKRLVCPDCGGPTDWSPDQQYLLYEPGATIAFIGRVEIATGNWVEWIKHPYNSVRGGRYSPDGQWIAFHAETAANERRVFIAPNEQQLTDAKWIPIAAGSPDGTSVDFLPSWSPDGNLLYFLSGRDGFRCIWAQRLNPGNKQPLGEPFPVQHFHRSRRSLLRLLSTRSPQIGFRVYSDRAYFAMDEVIGNLWMADLQEP